MEDWKEPQAEESLETLRQERDELKQKVEAYQRQEQIDREIWRAGAKNPIAVRALLDEEAVTPDEQGKFPKLAEALARLKEEESYLFSETRQNGRGLYGFRMAEGSDPSSDAFAAGFLNR